MNEKFEFIIQEADRLFENKDYKNALNEYEKSLVIYSTATYPMNQIIIIDKILADTKE